MSAIASLRSAAGLERALTNGGERAVHSFLKQYQRPLWVAFAQGWNGVLLVPEFRFGRAYRADFLLLSALSGAMYATLIELEPPRAKLYLRNGTESREFRTALRQVKDWAAWSRSYPDQLRREVAAEVQRAKREDRRMSRTYAMMFHNDLLCSSLPLFDEYAVVIGRRADLSLHDNAKRALESRYTLGVEVATYDRLLDIAREDQERARVIRNARDT